ncbi:MAG: polyprenyl synthetase family protein [Bacteroidota bacterium]
MFSFNDLLIKTDELLETVSMVGEPKELYEPMEYALAMGGKRLRPVLCLMACDMMGGKIEKAHCAAIALEIFHNFTLVHDDVMDKAPIRRGKSSVFSKWNSDIALLSGDTMFAIAYRELSKTEPVFLPDILKIFTQTAIEVCEGQQYDMNFETLREITMQEYLTMIRLKTAVLISCCLTTGALIGGASAVECEKMYQLGINLGMAFQLKDDLLDAFGNEKKFGKISGGDILTNKKTFLFIKALEIASAEQKACLLKYYSHTDFDAEEKIREIKDIYMKLDIPRHTEECMNEYHVKSLEIIDSLAVADANKAELLAVTNQLSTRDF